MFPRIYFITLLGWSHLTAFGVIMLRLAWASRAKLSDDSQPLPTRLTQYRSQSVLLAMFALFSLVTALSLHLDLFPRAWPSVRAAAFGALLYVIAVAGMRPRWRKAVAERRRVSSFFMPSTPVEKAWWVLIAVLAGVGEEITWRGVQFALLSYLFSNALAGALVCAAMFGMGHIAQGWRAVWLIAGFALVFQALVLWTGSLYVAMAVHTLYDITAGWHYGRYGRELAEREAGAQSA